MRRQGPISDADAARWLAEMQTAFPDVNEGDRITGRHEPGQGARFFVNGRLQREVREPGFATRFFGIWLSPQTSSPGCANSCCDEHARSIGALRLAGVQV